MDQLKCLEAVAKTGSFSGAAEQMYISHQAVGKTMRQLEDELGVTLFSKNGKGMELTLAGQEVLEFAQETLQRHKKLEEKLKEYRVVNRTEKRELRISSASAVTSIVLPDILAKMYAQDNNLSIKISASNQFEEIIETLRSGKTDMALFSITDTKENRKILESMPDLVVSVLARDELVALTKRGEKLESYEMNNTYTSTFSITPLNDNFREITNEHFTVSSVDIEFHKTLLDKMHAVVAMPGLAQQNFFNSKKYEQQSLPGMGPMEVVHIAIMRKDADLLTNTFLKLVKQELYAK